MDYDVSVILPTFNRADRLFASCESVLRQCHKNFELIVVDDGSTEDIRGVVERLDDPRVVYVRRPHNGGASAARNTGLQMARGTFIAFQDSDDLWLPGKLSRQLALLSRLPDDVGVVFGSKILYGRDERWRYGSGRVTCMPQPEGRLSLEEDQVHRFLLGNRISLQNALFRRSCMGGSMVWFDPCAKANADWEFTSRLAQNTRIYEDPEPVVVAFISPDSISKKPRKKTLGLMRILRKNRGTLARYPDAEAALYVMLASALAGAGKSRWAMSCVLTAARRHPPSILRAGGTLKKLLQRQLAARPHARVQPAASPARLRHTGA